MTQDATQTPGTQTSVLDSLVGAGKKFSDAEALARGKQEADTFIETLKREKAEALRLVEQQDEQIRTLRSKSSILDRLSANPDAQAVTPPVQTQTPPAPTAKGLTEEDVLKVVEKRELNARQQANKTAVDNGLVKVFGANAADKVRARCSELGIDPAEFNQLALSSPKGAFALLQINPDAPPGTTVYRGSGSEGAVANRSDVRNRSWYEAKKREMGPLKFMRDTQLMIQRHNDMNALGDAWDN